MPHLQPDDELTERAALYALGALTAEEVRAFEEHLSSGCSVCEEEVRQFRDSAAMLAHSARTSAPPAGLKSRVLSSATTAGEEVQVWKTWDAEESEIVRGSGYGWVPVMDGITARQLYVDPATGYVTMMIRMAPGAAYPAHRHGGAEQCFVLEGDIHVGAGEVLYAGDFQCMRTNSLHDVQWTERGCVLLLISSPNDELLSLDFSQDH